MCRDTGGAYNRGGIILCVATQEGVYPSHEGYTPLCVATQQGVYDNLLRVYDNLLCRDTGGGIPLAWGVYPLLCRDTEGGTR